MEIPLEQGQFHEWWLKGKIHHVWIQKRPDYCDRGHYIANIERAPGINPLKYSIDNSDAWPRYYMDFDRMVEEIRAWIKWREKDA